MAPGELLLRAYLEAQSDLGGDEAILPYPLVRKTGVSGSEPLPGLSGFEREPSRFTAQEEPRAAASVMEKAKGRGDFQDTNPVTIPPEGLLATLERALSEPASRTNREGSVP